MTISIFKSCDVSSNRILSSNGTMTIQIMLNGMNSSEDQSAILRISFMASIILGQLYCSELLVDYKKLIYLNLGLADGLSKARRYKLPIPVQ